MKVYNRPYNLLNKGLHVEISPENFVLLYLERYSVRAVGVTKFDEININLFTMEVTAWRDEKIALRVINAERIVDMRTSPEEALSVRIDEDV